MKAVQLPGYGANEWLIDLEYGEWLPRTYVLRSEGHQGTALVYPSREAAEEVIKRLEAGGEQARILHYREQVAEPEVKAPRRGRPPKTE